MTSSRRISTRTEAGRLIRALALTLAAALGIAACSASSALAVTGAISTTTNPAVDNGGTGTPVLCLNGGAKVNVVPAVNCNIYTEEQYVWLSGLPIAASLGEGTYFFAVLDPGGQRNPNDGKPGNLSCAKVETLVDCTGGAWTAREFTVDGSGNIKAVESTTHDVLANGAGQNEIRLAPYDETSNPGGVYIAAVCKVPATPIAAGTTGAPGVAPSDCKYDAFKVSASAEPCTSNCGGGVADAPTVSKSAAGSDTETFTWGIEKSVDKTRVEQSGLSSTFNYTVSVTHDAGTVSEVQVTGTIEVTNPNADPVSGVDVADQLSNGTECTVNGGSNTDQTVSSGKTTFPYTCTLGSLPGSITNTVTVTWPGQILEPSGDVLVGNNAEYTTEPIAFTASLVDNCATVTDTLGGSLGEVCSTDPSPTTFQYSHEVTGTSGKCVSQDNTATFTTNTTGTTGSDSKTVELCVGADLTVSKTASPVFTRTYDWNIEKKVDKTLVEQLGGGSATFNYTVKAAETGFIDSGWQVTGAITVSNPNDWEAVALSGVSDSIDNGGSCSITSGNTTASIPAGGSETFEYMCTYASAPSPAAFTNTASASWEAATASTPDGTASGTAEGAFGLPTSTVHKTVEVTDTFNGKTETLGTLTATDSEPFASATYPYSRTVSVPTSNCVKYTNTAEIVQTGEKASRTIEVCGPAKTGALTMGFWQNKNGQSIILKYSGTNCQALAVWLKKFHPFSDLTQTACGSSPSLGATAASGVVGYVYTVIKSAVCTSTSKTCNAMLKAQMLATALDVYFSDPALGGDRIGAPASIGGVTIDLTKICHMIDGSGGSATCGGAYENVSSAFGGATSMTVMNMLLYENVADPAVDAGAVWYGNVKATQVLAKDAFDAINNQVVFSP